MPTFAYTAVDEGGRVARGTREATDQASLRAGLGAGGMLLVESRPALKRADGASRRATVGAHFYRSLGTLVSAGLPLERALAEVCAQAGTRAGNSIAEVHARVLEGASLSAAMADFPAAFVPYEVALVRAGERGGALAEALERLARVTERDAALRSRLATAAVYPAMLAAVGALSLAVLLVFVVPRFADLLEGTGTTVPSSTRALLVASAFFADHRVALAVAAVALVAAVSTAGRLPAVRQQWSYLLLVAPWLSGLRRLQMSAHYARLLSTLLRGGAAPSSALDEVARSVADPAGRADAERVARAVREGMSLTAALEGSPVCTSTLKRLAALGERTARLPELLERSADLHEEELERQLDRLVRALEPAMTIAFGLIVGFIALSLLQAVYGVNASTLR